MFSVASVNHSVHSGEGGIHMTIINDALDFTVLHPPNPTNPYIKQGTPLPDPALPLF